MPIFSYVQNNKDKKVIKESLEILSKHPAFQNEKIAIMPDAHQGNRLSLLIGFTSTFSDKMIPNVVGVDIACRVSMYETPFTWADVNNRDRKFLEQFDNIIHAKVPAGVGFVRKDIHPNVDKYLRDDIASLRCLRGLHHMDNVFKSVGSLGGGKTDCFRTV